MLKLILLLTVFASLSLMAQSSGNIAFNKFFKNGEYPEALETLEKSDSLDFARGEKSYLEGVIYSKLQEFDKAIKSFEKAILEKNETPDLQYEYGQALFAANELRAARLAFKEPLTSNRYRSTSNYYIAYISQILEEYFDAKEKYMAVIKDPETDNQLRQIARFQLAETILSSLKESKLNKVEIAKNVSRSVIPMLKQAIKTDEKAKIVQDINQRIFEIQLEYDLDPDLLINGRRIPSKRYYGYFSQKIKSDNNVTLTSEENNIQQTKKDSFVFETEGYTEYAFVLNKRFIITPDFRFNFSQYSNQQDAEVYQNDSFSLNAKLKNKYEHILNDLPASLIFDLEYGKNYKDWKQTHKREAYSDSMIFGIGESFNYFKAGDTALRLKYKNYSGVNELLNNHTVSISGDQIVALANQKILIIFLEAEFINNFNNPTTSSNTIMGRFDYLALEVMPLYTLDLGLAGTFTDTKEQNAIRGTEITINPSINLSRAINESVKIIMSYDFSKNSSKSADYDYTKSVFSLGLNYSF